jgi:4'-phosphopantetheinyl transferase
LLTLLWPTAPPRWRLQADTIDVWAAALDRPADEVEALAATLSADERERARRFAFEAPRNQFTVARGLLRALLGGYLDVPPSSLAFVNGPQGKPALSGGATGLHFNISHTPGLALFAFTTVGEVGVDVEQLRQRLNHLDLAARFYAPEETNALRALPAETSMQGFLNAWTRKEALLKAMGVGLSFGSERVEVTLLPGAPVRVVGIDGDEAAAARWSLTALEPAPGYVAALAALGQHALRCWAWPPRTA